MNTSSPTKSVLRRPRVMLAVGAALVIVIVWLIAFFVPLGHRLSTLQSEQQSLQQEVGAGNARVARLRSESEHSAQMKAMVQKLEGYAPATSDISFIALLSDAAQTTGVAVTSIGPGTPTAVTGSPYETIPFSASVKGAYDNLLSFVHAIYALPRLTDIDTVSINGGGPHTNRSATLTATFELQIFISQTGARS